MVYKNFKKLFYIVYRILLVSLKKNKGRRDQSMNQLAKSFLNNQTFNNNLGKDLSLDNLQDEFNSYAFKVYLNGYIKKTIVLQEELL